MRWKRAWNILCNWGYIGIMENKMEITISGLGFRIKDSVGFRV